MVASRGLLRFLAQPGIEDCKLAAYPDSGGVWTIGVGHTLNVREGDTCTEEQALDWLAEDIGVAEAAVNRAITRAMLQYEFDAFTSLAFNIGAHAFGHEFGGVAQFNDGEIEKCADHFLLWNKVNGVVVDGLVKRRTSERAMFLNIPDPYLGPYNLST